MFGQMNAVFCLTARKGVSKGLTKEGWVGERVGWGEGWVLGIAGIAERKLVL